MTWFRGSLALVKVDIDQGMRRPRVGDIMLRLRRAGYAPVWMMEKRSRSGKGWHLAIKVKPTPPNPEAVVALQAILGSDPNRESCNLQRAGVLARMPRWARRSWNVLYQ